MRKTKWLLVCVILLFISVSPLLIGCKHKHDWSPLLYNDDVHYIQCNYCHEKDKIESHTYNEKNVCICGKRDYSHEHNYRIPGGDDDFHWISCDSCGSVINKIKHTLESGYAKTDEYHWKVCKNCNIKIKLAKHEFSGFACKQCGFPRPK